jgi:hypothetical protein
MTGSQRPIRRRRVLAALAATGATVGLAGCQGGGNGSSNGGDDNGDEDNGASGGDGGNGDGSGGGTGDDATGPGAGEQIEGISCAEFGSDTLQPYGSDNTPLVFDFEYPDIWMESRSSPAPSSDRYTVITHSEIIDSSKQTFLTVGQWFEHIPPETLEAEVAEEVEARSGREQFEVTRTVDYDGETIDVYSTPEYPEGLTNVFWLPYETAEGPGYFQTIFLFGYSNSFIESVDGSDVDLYCDSLFDDLADLVFPSITPNPQTTIADEL